ncbi:MAG: hypothetical protein KAV45_05530 [Calditrichia bacterium]|jgi:hypothetical protein|nr:hypothetical protein [Calditrichia bacterium]
MKRLSTLVLLLFLTSTALAQTPTTGSWSLLHTQTARTFEQGRLEIYTDLNFYTKLGDYLGSAPPDFSAVNYWVVASDIFTTYGIIDHLDMALGLRLYQDTNISDANIPDDLFLTIKAGSFTLGTRHLYGAAMLNFRFPLAEQPNYALAEYSSGSVEFGAMGALSYYVDPYLLTRNFSAHLNLGWYTHNDAGKIVDKRDRKPGFNATKLQYGLGLVYPVGMIDLMLEVNGVSWIQQPDTMVYGREEYTYVTPAIRYKPYRWMYADLGVDMRVSSDVEETKPPWASALDLPNYPDWKAWLALNFTLLPLAPSERTPEELERDRFNKRVDFFQNIIEERERIENVQEELDRLKREREEAEKELEELKQILEEEG